MSPLFMLVSLSEYRQCEDVRACSGCFAALCTISSLGKLTAYGLAVKVMDFCIAASLTVRDVLFLTV